MSTGTAQLPLSLDECDNDYMEVLVQLFYQEQGEADL